MQKNVIILSLSVSILLTGCAVSNANPKIDMEPPAYVEEMPPKAPLSNISNPGSLFGRGESPLFSDKKAMNTNDIVTVVISETLTQRSQASKATNRSNNDQFGGGIVTTDENSSLASAANTFNKYANIGFSTNSDSSFSGSGSNSRNENFATTISARIIKVLNNGNYFIEGSRELLLNGEKQIVQISGVIRSPPY